MSSVRTQTTHQRKNLGKMGTRRCEAESSGGGSRSSCPQISRYFSALGRSCGALSAVRVSKAKSIGRLMDQVWQRTKRLQPLHTTAELNPAVAELGNTTKRAQDEITIIMVLG